MCVYYMCVCVLVITLKSKWFVKVILSVDLGAMISPVILGYWNIYSLDVLCFNFINTISLLYVLFCHLNR